MSGGLEVLKIQDSDVTKMLAASTHLGSDNSDVHMESYVFKRRTDGINIIDLNKTWEKLLLAARAIAAIENPADVFVVSSRAYGQRAVLKFARYVGATPIAGRFTPGAFTNQIQAAFREPRVLVVADPRADHQPVTESSYANIPIIAFANVDSPSKHIDIAIPCNNKGMHSLGLMWWFLAREVLRLRGSIGRETEWEVMPDLFFYRDPEEAEKEEQAKAEALPPGAAPLKPEAENWGGDEATPDWSNEPVAGAPGASAAPAAASPAAPAPAAAAAAPKYQVTDDWATQGAVGVSDWAAESAAAEANNEAGQWGGSSNWN